MHRPLLPATVLACTILLSGCASILSSGSPQLLIESDPAGATVLVNGTEVGTTPYAYVCSETDDKEMNVELRKEGSAPRTFVLRPSLNEGILFADAMLLGLPYIMDAKDPRLHYLPTDKMLVHLYKAIPTDKQQLDLPVTTLTIALPAKGTLGKLGTRVLNSDSKELRDLRYPDMLTSAIVRGMKDTYVDASRIRLGTVKGDEMALQAKVVLNPVLKNADIQVKEQDNLLFGTVALDMEWQFYSGIAKDSVLFTVGKHSVAQIYGSRSMDLLTEAFQDAARQLLDEDGLYDRIAGQRALGLQLSKGDVVKLERPDPPVFSDSKNMIPTMVKGVVTLEVKDGHGSGFLITSNGYIMTNAHVVGNQATVKVRFEQGFSLDGQVVKVNRDFDLALVKVAGNDLPALALGDDHELQLGEELFAIGTPLDNQLGQTVTRGILSGNREIEGRHFLQTDVSINPGNSGGPLINATGRVVGVATMKVKAEGVEGIGFGVPISTAIEMLNIEFTK
jgi:hypothetical protein